MFERIMTAEKVPVNAIVMFPHSICPYMKVYNSITDEEGFVDLMSGKYIALSDLKLYDLDKNKASIHYEDFHEFLKTFY